jgi:ATP-dependent DNA ligase
VSKRVESRYKSGRCLSWVKVKNAAHEPRSGVSVSVELLRSGIGNRGGLLVRDVLKNLSRMLLKVWVT